MEAIKLEDCEVFEDTPDCGCCLTKTKVILPEAFVNKHRKLVDHSLELTVDIQDAIKLLKDKEFCVGKCDCSPEEEEESILILSGNKTSCGGCFQREVVWNS